MANRKRSEMLAPADEKPVRADHETARPQFHQLGKDGIEIALGRSVKKLDLKP